MNKSKVEQIGYLAAARKSALLSQAEMASIIGCSVPTLVSIEKNPKLVSKEVAKSYYANVGEDGKKLLRSNYPDFFTQ